MFQPAPLGDAGRGGIQEHQRAENNFLAGAAADEVEEKGECYGGGTGQE